MPERYGDFWGSGEAHMQPQQHLDDVWGANTYTNPRTFEAHKDATAEHTTLPSNNENEWDEGLVNDGDGFDIGYNIQNFFDDATSTDIHNGAACGDQGTRDAIDETNASAARYPMPLQGQLEPLPALVPELQSLDTVGPCCSWNLHDPEDTYPQQRLRRDPPSANIPDSARPPSLSEDGYSDERAFPNDPSVMQANVKKALELVHLINEKWTQKLASPPSLCLDLSALSLYSFFETGIRQLQRCFRGTLPNRSHDTFALMHVAFVFAHMQHKRDRAFWKDFASDTWGWLYAMSSEKEMSAIVRIWFKICCPQLLATALPDVGGITGDPSCRSFSMSEDVPGFSMARHGFSMPRLTLRRTSLMEGALISACKRWIEDASFHPNQSLRQPESSMPNEYYANSLETILSLSLEVDKYKSPPKVLVIQPEASVLPSFRSLDPSFRGPPAVSDANAQISSNAQGTSSNNPSTLSRFGSRGMSSKVTRPSRTSPSVTSTGSSLPVFPPPASTLPASHQTPSPSSTAADSSQCPHSHCQTVRTGEHHKTNMRKHIREKHRDGPKPMCEICRVEMSNMFNLKKHLGSNTHKVVVPEGTQTITRTREEDGRVYKTYDLPPGLLIR